MSISEEKVKEVMADAWQIEADDIPSDVALNDFPHWDSLGHVSLLVGLEKEFGIEINNETVTALNNLSTIVEYLQKRRC